MSLLQWDEGFETGIPAADHEHGKLVDLINSVYDSWERERAPDRSKFFDEIFDILLSHFEFEDRIMSGSGYSDHRAHSQDHDQVLDQLRGIIAHTDDADFDVMSAFASCLRHWLADHIKSHDVPLYKALVSSGVAVGTAAPVIRTARSTTPRPM